MKTIHLALCLLILASSAASAVSPPEKAPVPRLAVLPFVTPSDQDYGVLISDRLVTGLFHHRDVPALGIRRYELVEPDAFNDETMEALFANLSDLPPQTLEKLRAGCRADYVILGNEIVSKRITNPGVKTMDLSILDLATGDVIWANRIKHDVRYIWLSKEWEGGEACIRDIISQLGFIDYDRQLPVFNRGTVPKKIALMPLHNVGNPIMVKAAERFIHQGLIEDKIFSVVYKGTVRLPRAEAAVRENALEKKAEAVFIGSMMDAGMEEAVEENITTAARLVDVETGRILWSGSASHRRVWRRESPDQLAQHVANQLIQDFFETVKRTEAQRLDKLRRKVGIRVIK